MLRFSKNCSYCGNEMDSFDEKCPVCYEANNDPVVKKEKMVAHFVWWRQLLFFAVGWVGFQVIGSTVMLLLNLIGHQTSSLTNFLTYILLCSAMVLIIWTDSKEILKSFKSWKPFVFGIAGYIVILILANLYENTAFAILGQFGIKQAVNSNEASVREVSAYYPLLSFIIFGFIGPICEELTYRVGLFGLTRRVNLVFAFVITTIVFACIHFKDEALINFIINPSDSNRYTLIIELVNLPSYMIAGFVFTFLYHKWGFAASITAHVANNSLIIIMQTIRRGLEGLLNG